MDAKTRLVIRLYRAGRKTGADVLAALADPTEGDLLEAAELMGLKVPEGADAGEIAGIIGGE